MVHYAVLHVEGGEQLQRGDYAALDPWSGTGAAQADATAQSSEGVDEDLLAMQSKGKGGRRVAASGTATSRSPSMGCAIGVGRMGTVKGCPQSSHT